jgi:acetoin:2,6-dichlorophenolindophenol oxidoreductase subunit beta
MRELSYCEAINEALKQEMLRDPTVFVYGLGAPDHRRIFGSTAGLLEQFGSERCFDTPLSEEAMTGFGLGAAINGMRPVHVHIRADFLLLAMNQLVNMVASYTYSTLGEAKVPLVIRAVLGRGWGQGYQHSKSMQSIFAHIPGLKVVMPTTPRDAKGLLTAAIRDDNPVLVLEHRWLYWATGPVAEEPFIIEIGKCNVLRPGKDVTVVATSWMNVEALRAAELLEAHGVSLEVIDVRSLSPLDGATIVASVKRTSRCIVADYDWIHCGFGAEVAALVSENCFGSLAAPVRRIGFAPTHCPTTRCLESRFYPNALTIVRLVEEILALSPPLHIPEEKLFSYERRFKGPF